MWPRPVCGQAPSADSSLLCRLSLMAVSPTIAVCRRQHLGGLRASLEGLVQ